MNPDRMQIHLPAFSELVDRIARFERVTIGGKVYTAEYLIPLLTINAKDLLTEAATTPAMVLYWNLEAARARLYRVNVDNSYRQWRELRFKEFKIVAEGDKAPSDKMVEAQYRTTPEYGEWQKRLAEAQYGAECAEAIAGAFQAKKELIKTQTEVLRNEAGGGYYSVVEDPRTSIPRQPQLS